MKDKNVKIIIICSIFVAMFFSIVGFTYAIFKLQITGNDNASSIITNLGSLELTFIDGEYISATDFMPPWTYTKTITITNTGTETTSYYLVWETLTNTFVNKSLLTYTVTNAGAGSTLSQTQIPNSGENIQILPQTSIAVGETHTYTITFNYENSSMIDQSSDMRKVFSGKLKVTDHLLSNIASCSPNSNTLYCKILELNPEYTTQIVQDDSMFQTMATTDMGLWTENRSGKTEDDLPVYFFRGAVNDNYVSFAGKMWRIVRINEDGTVKLILGGNSTTDGYGGELITYNPNYDLIEYMDYSRSDNALRVENQSWYSDDNKGNIDVYESYIADTMFCNDKSNTTVIGNTYFGSFLRVTGLSTDGFYTPNSRTKTPQFKCPNSDDNLLYKIGALTADEVIYAGGSFAANNSSYYLYDNAQESGASENWWLLSPYLFYNNYTSVFFVSGSSNAGLLNYYYTYAVLNYRPTISLKYNTEIITGDGDFDSPFVITL